MQAWEPSSILINIIGKFPLLRMDLSLLRIGPFIDKDFFWELTFASNPYSLQNIFITKYCDYIQTA